MDPYVESTLYKHSKAGNVKDIEVIVQSFSECNVELKLSLFISAEKGHLRIVKMLLEPIMKCSSTSQKSSILRDLLIRSCRGGDVDTIKHVLKQFRKEGSEGDLVVV